MQTFRMCSKRAVVILIGVLVATFGTLMGCGTDDSTDGASVDTVLKIFENAGLTCDVDRNSDGSSRGSETREDMLDQYDSDEARQVLPPKSLDVVIAAISSTPASTEITEFQCPNPTVAFFVSDLGGDDESAFLAAVTPGTSFQSELKDAGLAVVTL